MPEWRMYKPEGFTDQIVAALAREQLFAYDLGDLKRFDEMPGQILLALAEKLPTPNLQERQNNGPSIQSFMDLALEHPTATFIGYVVLKTRDDERLSIEGCHLPAEVDVQATAIGRYPKADEDNIEGGRRRLWWD